MHKNKVYKVTDFWLDDRVSIPVRAETLLFTIT
jgi:hypothetical protein